jgi:hypothetical protein
LRRLAEGADEGAAHPLRITKAGRLRDVLDRLAGGLHALPRHLDSQPLQRIRRAPIANRRLQHQLQAA